jgi:hypothetical protein
MADPRLDWNTAEVSDSTLKVALDGETPRGWRETFERTVELLGSGDWERVKLKKRRVEVSGVTPGSEEKLRHHLEGIVQEANAAHPTDAAADDGEDDKDAADDSEDERPAPDAEMTERFRSFAQSPPSS